MSDKEKDTKRIEEIRHEIRELQLEREIILDCYLDEGQEHKVGVWSCTGSPVGVCIYHRCKDPHSDQCVYCGQPHERNRERRKANG